MDTWYITESDLESIRIFVSEGHFKKVGLQFPNELLDRSVNIAKQLDEKIGSCTCAILADTTFGSCCVDEVAGQHYCVDAIVHFGPACLTSGSQVPVKYVFGHVDVNEDQLHQSLQSLSFGCVIVVYDFLLLDSVKSAVQPSPSCILSLPNLPELIESSESGVTLCGRFLPDRAPTEDWSDAALVYIGWSDLCLTSILFSFPICAQYFWFDVDSHEIKTLDRQREMRRRMLLIEKASTAERVGLLVGTLGGSGKYMAMLDRLRRKIREQGKRCYTLMVGKLNPMKLQNFSNLDCFVLVACSQNTLFDIRKSKEDYSVFQPIVTPYEMEQACLPSEERVWNMTFISDFENLLKLAENEENIELSGNKNDAGVRSLLRGLWLEAKVTPSASSRPQSLKSNDTFHSPVSVPLSSDPTIALAPNKLLVERNPDLSVSCHLPQRAVEEGSTWFGLEPDVGKTPVTAPKPGRRGIAIAYEEETT